MAAVMPESKLDSSKSPIGVLFVCLGNICRSPVAECVFRHHATARKLEGKFTIDSAGTSGYHDGDSPDDRSVAAARKRGVTVEGVSRKLVPADLRSFHYVIAMDSDNLAGCQALQRKHGGTARLHLLREWDAEASAGAKDVPDPYYGGASGFDEVHSIADRSCAALLDHLVREHSLA